MLSTSKIGKTGFQNYMLKWYSNVIQKGLRKFCTMTQQRDSGFKFILAHYPL